MEQHRELLTVPTMTIFFTIVALVHLFGLFAMLLALRSAPVAVSENRGFQTIAESEQARENVASHAQARTA